MSGASRAAVIRGLSRISSVSRTVANMPNLVQLVRLGQQMAIVGASDP